MDNAAYRCSRNGPHQGYTEVQFLSFWRVSNNLINMYVDYFLLYIDIRLYCFKYQMKQIDSRNIIWYKAGKLYMYVNNEYQYVILLKGWLSTVMDEAANGAHQGTTRQMEHSKYPKTEKAAMSGELLISYIICDLCFKMEYFSCFVTSVVEMSPVVLEKKLKKLIFFTAEVLDVWTYYPLSPEKIILPFLRNIYMLSFKELLMCNEIKLKP